MKKIAAALMAAFLLAGFEISDAENRIIGGKSARLAMEAFGFKEVRIVGPIFLGCDKNDTIRIQFEAIAPGGQRVKAQACGGLLFKGWTVRIDEVIQ